MLFQDVLREKDEECDQGCLRDRGSLCHGLAMGILSLEAELRGEGGSREHSP